MTVKEIIALTNAGYTKEDIQTLVKAESKAEPKTEQKPKTDPKEEPKDPILEAIADLKTTIQSANIQKAEQPKETNASSDESLIDALFGKKGE